MPGIAELFAAVVTGALLSLLAYPQTSYECWGSWTGRHATTRLRLKIAGAHAAFAVVVAFVATKLGWAPGDNWILTGAAWGTASAALLRLDWKGGFEADRSEPALSLLRYYVMSLERGVTRRLDPVITAWAEERAETDGTALVASADYIRLHYIANDGRLGWPEYKAAKKLLAGLEQQRRDAELQGIVFAPDAGETRELVVFIVTKSITYRITKDWLEAH